MKHINSNLKLNLFRKFRCGCTVRLINDTYANKKKNHLVDIYNLNDNCRYDHTSRHFPQYCPHRFVNYEKC